MTRYDDEDFDDTPIMGTEMYTESDYNKYLADEDNDYLLRTVQNVSKVAETISSLNSKEVEKNLRNQFDILTQVFLSKRLEYSMRIEDAKKVLINRLMEVKDTLTGKELIEGIKLLSDATSVDLNAITGAKSGGININVAGPTNKYYDNSVTNTQNNVIAEQANFENQLSGKVNAKTVNSLGRLDEAYSIFKTLNVPRQDQITYDPAEKFSSSQAQLAEFVETNIQEDKEQEEKMLNEE